ncbi:hypothetical protein OPV22_025330 [Ensete ventricosum]|uniref:DUF641 domain-containing protein n=1 Tax=Ensete ventricosum TaxID=4639 RepID=A0AAV8QH96_ENSVE|nr:hypothetical protein OPV22_025330 [Ensete ventricosum]
MGLCYLGPPPSPNHQDPPPSANDGAIHNLKLSRDFGDYFGLLSDPHGDGLDIPDDEKKQLLQQQQSLLANLFASISAVNAAYVQLQVAQSSCDLESIQSGDGAVVAELRRISELKRSYFRNQFDLRTNPIVHPALSAQLQELKTHRITACKLRLELVFKDSEILALGAELLE